MSELATHIPFDLRRNPFGRLELTLPDGHHYRDVLPVRAFPLTAPDEGLSLVGDDGHELAWVDRMASLPADTRRLLEEELALLEFIPVITRIVSVSGFATPCTWAVETDRGPTQLVLKAEEDIRRLGRGRLLIASGDGMQFLVADTAALDRPSRRLLERFL
ncbi:MAG TPA: DUF1854 domain-containing protein [Burkholderiaceae bacterium]